MAGVAIPARHSEPLASSLEEGGAGQGGMGLECRVRGLAPAVLPPASVLLLLRMREVDLGCGKALLIKESGEFYAMGHKCPHYGAPLVKGLSVSLAVRIKMGGKAFAKGSPEVLHGCCGEYGVVPFLLTSSQHLLGEGSVSSERWQCRSLQGYSALGLVCW